MFFVLGGELLQPVAFRRATFRVAIPFGCRVDYWAWICKSQDLDLDWRINFVVTILKMRAPVCLL